MTLYNLASPLCLFAVLSITSCTKSPSPDRARAFDLLVQSYQRYATGDESEGRKGIDQALAMDPNLAYANIVRAEIAMKDGDWSRSQRHFEKGLDLLDQPNQPISPNSSAPVTRSDVEGDARCFLGYVYIKRAMSARQDGDESAEQRFLGSAHENLLAGLQLTPGPEARDLAEGLLQSFK